MICRLKSCLLALAACVCMQSSLSYSLISRCAVALLQQSGKKRVPKSSDHESIFLEQLYSPREGYRADKKSEMFSTNKFRIYHHFSSIFEIPRDREVIALKTICFDLR